MLIGVIADLLKLCHAYICECIGYVISHIQYVRCDPKLLQFGTVL